MNNFGPDLTKTTGSAPTNSSEAPTTEAEALNPSLVETKTDLQAVTPTEELHAFKADPLELPTITSGSELTAEALKNKRVRLQNLFIDATHEINVLSGEIQKFRFDRQSLNAAQGHAAGRENDFIAIGDKFTKLLPELLRIDAIDEESKSLKIELYKNIITISTKFLDEMLKPGSSVYSQLGHIINPLNNLVSGLEKELSTLS